jgi:hypothetical protein
MTARYLLAPQAAFDLFEIWDYIKEQTGISTMCRESREAEGLQYRHTG